MNCPRCKTVLSVKIVKELQVTLEVDQCENCGGTWFDQGEIRPIDLVVEPVLWEKRNIPTKSSQLLGLHCPKCEEKPLLDKIPHPRDHKVIIDQCSHCSGVWLDKGEIEAIQKENYLSAIVYLFSK